MAINTKQARKIAEYKRDKYFNNYMAQFCSLFNNSVRVEGEPPSTPKRYLLKVLREFGAIAYDKQTGLYLRFVASGIDVYGLPQRYHLIGYNGFNVMRKPNEVVILRANDLRYPIIEYLTQQIYKLVDIDLSIEQNLDAIKTMTIVEVPDQSTLLSFANEQESRRLGASVVFRNKTQVQGGAIKTQSTGAQYLVDKLMEARKEIMNETLSSIGISVANVDKRERVQVAEVVASQGYALDSINTLIDTFNHDAEIGGLSIRLKGNTSLIVDKEIAREQDQEGEEENEI